MPRPRGPRDRDRHRPLTLRSRRASTWGSPAARRANDPVGPAVGHHERRDHGTVARHFVAHAAPIPASRRPVHAQGASGEPQLSRPKVDHPGLGTPLAKNSRRAGPGTIAPRCQRRAGVSPSEPPRARRTRCGSRDRAPARWPCPAWRSGTSRAPPSQCGPCRVESSVVVAVPVVDCYFAAKSYSFRRDRRRI